MSDDTLRDRILWRLAYHDVSHDAHNTADEILDEVREALLSDAAVEAMCEAGTEYAKGAFYISVADKKQVRNSLTAAMNAAGLGGDGHE